MRRDAFTLVEMLGTTALVLVLGALLAGTGASVLRDASLAVSANNLRQLGAGASAYLGDNNQTFWKYRESVPGQGVKWWFGFEPISSLGAAEGERTFDPEGGPLGGYVPAGFRPDPSFRSTGRAFKPKYRFGYLGIAYNVLLAHSEFNSRPAWLGSGTPARLGRLEDPSRTVVFATSAQVNTFQPPASVANPMLEEFYGIDEREVTVHFRHRGKAMVVFATGNAGFLPLDETTLDARAPGARVGRFAPVNDYRYLK